MENSSKRAVVIGGGIIGATTALKLQRAGLSVSLVERNNPGEGCSFGNGGAISPDVCVPIALPGMLRKVPRWLFDPKGPLVLRWGYLPKALPWLLRWIRAGREDRVREVSHALRALHAQSYVMYEELLGERAQGLIEMTGQIYAWRSEQPAASEAFSQALRAEFGIEVQSLDTATLQGMEPDLCKSFRSGLFFPENGHTLNPLRLVQTLVTLFEQAGGRVLRETVRGFDVADGKATAVLFDKGHLDSDLFVLAAGIDSGTIARKLGDRIPLQAERGYHVMLPNSGIAPRIKISNRESMFGMTPLETGVRIAGTVEIASPDAPMDEARAHAMLDHARNMYPGINTEDATYWMGSRPSIPDSLPVIDRSSRHDNVIYAFGHGHFGLTGAPMTAELVTSRILGRPGPVPHEPYELKRFGGS